MKLKKRFLPFFKITSRIFLILLISTLAFYHLISYIIDDYDNSYLSLIIPVSIVLLFIIVALIVTEIYRFIFNGSFGEFKSYSSKEMFYLLGKCFLVILSGGTIGILYKMNLGIHRHDDVYNIIFYCSDFVLVFYSIIGIIKSEQLREINYRRIENENELLKSKVNPHFLYNTLNNIDSLIWTDQEKASESIIKLSSLMRYMTYQTEKNFIPIEDEINHIREYIELQKIRLQNPDTIRFTTEIQNKSVYIAPMLIIPFVENGFKHGLFRDKEMIIDIKADPDRIFFQMSNYINNQQKKEKDGGMGMKVVKRRLKLIYKNDYNLVINSDKEVFTVKLTITI